MARFFIVLSLLAVASLALSPVVAAFDPDPVPGDINFHLGTTHIFVPVVYSLCASLGLALLYMVMKR